MSEPVSEEEYLAGRGIADITGEAAECGMLGYGKGFQRTRGLHTRLRSRAFVIVDPATDQRVLLSVNDLPMVFDSVRAEVLDRLRAQYGELYNDRNTVISATHTHCGPGGYSYHRLYNSNTGGFRPQTFGAIVDGIYEAIDRAHRDLAPARLRLGHVELHDASVNRSPQSFERNPASDRDFFPGAVDSQSTVLAIERGGALAGVINWFPTHCTSMTNQNRLISFDNKGYAAYHWERVVLGQDYLEEPEPAFIGAFAQTNAGDMSPNLGFRPGHGPTEDDFENTRIIGERQYEAARTAVVEAATIAGPVDSRVQYFNLARARVEAEYTGTGQAQRTGTGWGGAASLAGTDEGAGFRGFKQGRNGLVDLVSNQVLYRLSERLRESQAPKGLVIPGFLNRLVPLIQEVVPVQLLRIGPLYLITIPGEATIVSGLRLRRTVAEILGAPIRNVLVTGYSNAYIHYITTPEEYEAQRYEGGSTLYGKWELGAFMQTAATLAQSMRDSTDPPRHDPPPRLRSPNPAKGPRGADQAPPGRRLGDVLSPPRAHYQAGDQVRTVIAGTHPNNNLHRGSTYLEVQRHDQAGWVRVADDGDWSTKLHWARRGPGESQLTISWDIPPDASAGRYRIAYHGDARDPTGQLSPLEVTTEEFQVRAVVRA